MPSVPTVAESGFPGFEATNWYAFVAPGKTPSEILDYWNRELVRVLKDPQVSAELARARAGLAGGACALHGEREREVGQGRARGEDHGGIGRDDGCDGRKDMTTRSKVLAGLLGAGLPRRSPVRERRRHRAGQGCEGHGDDRARGSWTPALVGMRVQAADVVRTGADGSVGITMSDSSLLSAGPNSIVSLDRYEFDATTGNGRFDTSLSARSLAVVSGRIAKQSPEAMTVRTPFAVLEHRIRGEHA